LQTAFTCTLGNGISRHPAWRSDLLQFFCDMKITLRESASASGIFVPAGDYWVSLGEAGQINLAGRGNDYKLQAQKRPSARKTKVTNILFYSMGGPIWTLVVQSPNRGEWFVLLKYGSGPESA
jgi:hypothetical protein